jgi:hypothetical protein
MNPPLPAALSPAYCGPMIDAGCQRGPLPGTVGITGAYQAVSSTIPASSTNAWALLA